MGWIPCSVVVMGLPVSPGGTPHFQSITLMNMPPCDKLSFAPSLWFAARLPAGLPPQRGASMTLTADDVADINLLTQFNLANTHEGLKIHQGIAAREMVAPAARRFKRGLLTMRDAGILPSR